MEFFHLIHAYPLLSLAQTAFMVWMLVDVYRRRGEQFWFWVILFLPVAARWVYFFAVKAGDFRGLSLGSLFQPRASLDELRYRVEQSPTLAHRLELAERLMENGLHQEAIPHLEAVLKQEPSHATALHALALCHKELGASERAIPLLEKLAAGDPHWSNYRGWCLLIDCRELTGDRAGALEACRALVRLAPMMKHQCLLAEQLVALEQAEEARAVLDRALQDYAFAPAFVRRRDRRWASQAGRLQKQVAVKR